jgi:hypothetical protein
MKAAYIFTYLAAGRISDHDTLLIAPYATFSYGQEGREHS